MSPASVETASPSLRPADRRLLLAFLDFVCVISMRSEPLLDLCLPLGVRRTRTLGLRCSPELVVLPLPPSKYSISSDVCDLLARWPALIVTGVPSEGSE